MKAVIIGATGATGSALIEQLLSDEDVKKVTALTRRPYFQSHPKLEEVIVDFDRLENFSSHITGDVAYSCLGTTLKDAGGKKAQWKIDYDYQLRFAELAVKNKIPVFVLMSSMGANPKSKIFYSRMKGDLEIKIEETGFSNLLIFQPGLLIRPGSDRAGEKFSVSIIRFFNRLGIARGYKPVSVGEVAAAMIKKSKNPTQEIERVKLKEIFRLAHG